MNQLGRSGACELMHPPRDGNDYDSANNGCEDNWHPLVGDESETVHKTDTCWHKEEAEVMDKEAGEFVDPPQFHNAKFERGAQKYHADYT